MVVGFRRSTVTLGQDFLQSKPVTNNSRALSTSAPIPSKEQFTTDDVSVLVLNSSHEMAKEITLQLTLKIPGCSIQYAPTIQLAKWMLSRKKIDLIVASPVLPDGSVTILQSALLELENPPDLVVVGALNITNAEALSTMGYEYSRLHRIDKSAQIQNQTLPIIHKRNVSEHIRSLGADLRNDLNNPLQEIVAMVFVAKASGESSATSTALEAIDKAAQNLAGVVKGLETRILGAVL